MRMRILQLLWFSICSAAVGFGAAETVAPQPPATTAAVEAAKPEQPNLKAAKRVYVIPVRAEIGSAVLYVVRRGIKEAIQENADVIVFDMKTPGGSLGPTLEIMEAIAKFPRTTVTYVNSEAMSAGAFIAATTHEIWFSPDGIMGAAAPVSMGGQEVEATMKQKVVSYLKARVRAVSEGKGGYRGDVVSAMIDADREFKIGDKVIKEKGELLSLTANEAAKTYGDPPEPLLSAGTAKNLDELISRVAGERPVVTKLEMTWSETLAAWLNSIAPVLLGLGMLALFIEFKTPGFGVFGVTGIVLLAIVFLSSYVAGLSGHEPVLFFVIGLILLAVEVFFFPGTIIMGLAGVVLLLGSLIWAMADLWPNEPLTIAWSADAFGPALINLALGLLIAVGLGAAVVRFLPHGWVWDKLVLSTSLGSAAQVAGGGADGSVVQATTSIVGKRGIAATTLRPSGQIDIEGRRYEARVEVGTVVAGTPVVVVRRTDFELIVEEVST